MRTPQLIAVTGATGFTGPFVMRALAARFPGVRLRCLVRPTSETSVLQGTAAQLIIGDLREPASLDRLFAGADTVVNVASLGFDWTDGVIAALQRARVGRGIFIGTTAMLTRLPVRSKPIRERAEALIRDSGIDWTILRPTMIYGTPADRNISRLVRFVMRSPIVPVPAAEARQQPIHVADVADAVVRALESNATPGRAYNIAGAKPLTMYELVEEVVAAVGRRRVLVRVPSRPLLAAVRVQSALLRRSPITPEQIRRLEEDKAFDYSDAARDFGFAPRTFHDGVRDEVRLMLRPGVPVTAPPVSRT